MTRTFTVRNWDMGIGPLLLGTPTVPDGYTITQPLDASIPPGGSATFTVQLSTAKAGTFAGTISFPTNDSDNGDGVENPFTFFVSGNVTVPATGYAVRYSLSPVGELDGSNTTANGINDNRQIVGETN